MDFGHLGFDTFNSVSNNGGSVLENGGEISKQQKWCGFGALKQQQQQQERGVSEDDLRDSKMAKTTSCNEAMLRFPVQRYNGSEGHQQMLSFSSPYSHPVNLPYYPHGSSPFGRNTAGGINGGSMQMQQGLRGLFTASQWMELEHQALIYKYITANVPIPSYLLNPIRKAFESAGFLRSNALGWGGFQLGFANSDPEPGRCRRTDGKKWRCSRDAVAEQKYCERHMNRGRHRSRKPVEAQPTNSASTTATTNGKLAAAGGLSNLPKMQPTPTARLSAISTINRSVVDKEDTNDGAYHQHDLSSPKHHQTAAASQESSFGLVCSDSLLNPLNRSSSLVNCKSQQHPLRQFMDDWPKTQLSISIPIATSDFMSSTSSPTKSPRELEMGLGVGPVSVERNQRQMNWVPLSMGGPLGEVLQECKSTKPLNLIDSWENSPRLASSPTGVLQRGAFGSVSNSSTASSPRAETGGSMNPGFILPAL